jgi:hypothetical protein
MKEKQEKREWICGSLSFIIGNCFSEKIILFVTASGRFVNSKGSE